MCVASKELTSHPNLGCLHNMVPGTSRNVVATLAIMPVVLVVIIVASGIIAVNKKIISNRYHSSLQEEKKIIIPENVETD